MNKELNEIIEALAVIFTPRELSKYEELMEKFEKAPDSEKKIIERDLKTVKWKIYSRVREAIFQTLMKNELGIEK